MKIAIDIDDTLTNTKDTQIRLWKEYIKNNPNPNYTEELPSNINEFDTGEYLSIFWDTYRDILSFESTYKQDASIIIDKLKAEGHELCIVTSRPDDRYTNLHERISKALKDNNIHIDTIYSNARDKGSFCKEHNFDLLIDDNIKQIESALNNGLKGILFNKTDKDILQVSSWQEIYEIINNM